MKQLSKFVHLVLHFLHTSRTDFLAEFNGATTVIVAIVALLWYLIPVTSRARWWSRLRRDCRCRKRDPAACRRSITAQRHTARAKDLMHTVAFSREVVLQMMHLNDHHTHLLKHLSTFAHLQTV
jgi:hypothetical protein